MTSSSNLQRPTTMAELLERSKLFNSEEGRRLGLAFQPRPTDLFISPFPKCGTTWLQQIVHGLRTRGDMNFREITEVTPWVELAHDLGLELNAPQPMPRAFKSHLGWQEIPKGARYLVSFRHPKDALISFYHFFEGWWFVPGTISMTEFASVYFLEGRGYWRHLASWWEQRANPNVLLLTYEDMKVDLTQTVRIIADFIGCELDTELLEIVVRQSSLLFMLAHAEKFDDHLVRTVIDPVCGLPPGGDSFKVTGRDGTSPRPEVQVTQEISEQLDAVWQEEIEAKFGLPSYQALREEVARDLRARFAHLM